jgi:chromosome segregation ATPase
MERNIAMPSKHDQPFDPARPALVLVYGDANAKHRYLDRDALLVGRARGCDLGLDANDISSLHCVITRGDGRYQVRDCQSRAGTKVNGNAVREQQLVDGDLLQIGPFSFRVHLPAGCSARPLPPQRDPRLDRLERSRRRFAQIALQQRKLLQQAKKNVGDTEENASPGLKKQLSSLRARVSEYDRRSRVLEDAERDLARDREILQCERNNFREQVEQTEQELAAKRRAADEAIEAQRQQLQEEAQQLRTPPPAAIPVAEAAPTAPPAKAADTDGLKRHYEKLRKELGRRARQVERIRAQAQADAAAVQARKTDLQHRADELIRREQEIAALHAVVLEKEHASQHLAEELRARELRIDELETLCRQGETSLGDLQRVVQDLESENNRLKNLLAEKLELFAREQKELSMMREQWANDQDTILQRLARQKAAMAQVEEVLQEQRRSLDDVLVALQQPQGGGTESEQMRELADDNERLRRLLAEQTGTEDELNLLRRENREMHALLAELETQHHNGTKPASMATAESAAELEQLRAQLQEKDKLIEEMRVDAANDLGGRDPETYEAELNKFRRQLEADRKKLNHELEQMRVRNEELDQATREMELEMSRDRADLARERQRLERLREDVRLELERVQRDGGMRDRLAPVQNLRDEINGRRNSTSDQTPKPSKEDALQGRLRSLRNRMMDS